MPHLKISTPDAGIITFDLENEVTTIGRIDENDLTIEDNSISSYHAKLTLVEEGVAVEDLGSTNGTKLNGEPITTATISGGETITFGSIDVEFVADAPAEAVTGSSEAPAQPDSEDYTAVPAEVSKRPDDFVSEAPFPKKKKESDPLQTAALAAGIVALLAFGGSLALVLSMTAPL